MIVLKLKSPLKNYFLGQRRPASTTYKSLCLPEGIIGGSSEGTTEYRLVDILDVPEGTEDFKVGDTVLIHELDKTPFNIDITDRNLQVIPREKIMGVQDKDGNLRPIDNIVFAEFLPDKEDTAGGIIIPEMVRQFSLQTKVKVYATGPDCRELSIGDTVLIRKDFGVFFQFGSAPRCLAIKEDSDGVVCLVEE